MILTWILGYYKQVLFCALCATLFYSGWHLRDLQEIAKQQKNLEKQLTEQQKQQDFNYAQSSEYEKVVSEIYQDTININQDTRNIHANDSYNCALTPDELRILTAITPGR